jgi:hypothetical protein
MSALLAASPRFEEPQIVNHDRVRVPDGRIGEVVGFYRREDEWAVVSFSSGMSAEFLVTQVEAC